MACRVTVNIRIGHGAVGADVKFPAPVRIEAPRTDIGLVAGTVHIVHKNARHFGKYLAGCFFGDIRIHILKVDHLTFFTGPEVRALRLRQAADLFKLGIDLHRL